jgi:hypothetical protein
VQPAGERNGRVLRGGDRSVYGGVAGDLQWNLREQLSGRWNNVCGESVSAADRGVLHGGIWRVLVAHERGMRITG